MADIGEVRAKITADVSSFTTGMQGAQQSIIQFHNAVQGASGSSKTFYEGLAEGGDFAVGSERGVRRLELALGAISAQAVGASGAIGTLGEGTLLLAGGSMTAVGTLAVLAESFGIYKLATSDADGLAKATGEIDKVVGHLVGRFGEMHLAVVKINQDLQDYLDRSNTIHGIGMALAGGLRQTLEQFGLGGLAAKVPIDLFDPNQTSKIYQDTAKAAAQSAEALERGATASALAKESTKELVSLEEERVRAAHDIQEAADKQTETLAVQRAELEAQLRSVFATGKTGEAFWSDADIARVTRMKLAMEGITGVLADQIIASTIANEHLEANITSAESAARESARRIAETTRQQMQQMREIGRSAIEQFVQGVFQGTLDFGRLLEGILTKFITDKITTVIFAALGIASPSKVGIEAGQYVAQGLALGMTGSPTMMGLGDMRLRLEANMSGMPAPLNPFEAARDATTQRWFREASLVANQGGFTVGS